MLIDLHGHHLTKGMLNLDPHWGPHWEGTLRVGDWRLGTKKLPDSAQVSNEENKSSSDAILSRMDYEYRYELMDKLGVDVLVISIPAHCYMYWTGDFGVRWAKTANDEYAEWTSKDTERFKWWAAVPMHRPQQAADELERAVGMGAVGFSCGGGNYGGGHIHDRELDVLWAKASELDVPVFIHGYNDSVTWGKDAMNDPFDTTSIVGMCYDETRAFWQIIKGGVLDRFPNLKFYITHSGGFVPYQLIRFSETSETMAPDAVNEKPLLEYMPSFWFDPQVPVASMRKAIVDVIGVDRLVVGTNFMGSDQIDFDLTEGLGLSDEDREKIRSGNAIKLLKLKDRSPQAA